MPRRSSNSKLAGHFFWLPRDAIVPGIDEGKLEHPVLVIASTKRSAEILVVTSFGGTHLETKFPKPSLRRKSYIPISRPPDNVPPHPDTGELLELELTDDPQAPGKRRRSYVVLRVPDTVGVSVLEPLYGGSAQLVEGGLDLVKKALKERIGWEIPRPVVSQQPQKPSGRLIPITEERLAATSSRPVGVATGDAARAARTAIKSPAPVSAPQPTRVSPKPSRPVDQESHDSRLINYRETSTVTKGATVTSQLAVPKVSAWPTRTPSGARDHAPAPPAESKANPPPHEPLRRVEPRSTERPIATGPRPIGFNGSVQAANTAHTTPTPAYTHLAPSRTAATPNIPTPQPLGRPIVSEPSRPLFSESHPRSYGSTNMGDRVFLGTTSGPILPTHNHQQIRTYATRGIHFNAHLPRGMDSHSMTELARAYYDRESYLYASARSFFAQRGRFWFDEETGEAYNVSEFCYRDARGSKRRVIGGVDKPEKRHNFALGACLLAATIWCCAKAGSLIKKVFKKIV